MFVEAIAPVLQKKTMSPHDSLRQNDEIRMPNAEGNEGISKEKRFLVRASSLIRHSSLVIRH
jgi:hypothetical protein